MTFSNHKDVVLYGGQGDVFASLKLTLTAEHMPYLMLETSEYGIQFGSTEEYAFTPEWTVLRLHAFGCGGDLMIRRDEDRVMWRFVGDKTVFNKMKLTNGTPYTGPLEVNEKDNHSLLWGVYKGQNNHRQHQWHENRVGKAKLTYPVSKSVAGGRVAIRARRVFDTHTHETIAYWTYELVGYQPQEDKS